MRPPQRRESRKETQKATLDATAAKQTLEAQEKVYQSRKQLFEQGAMPRKELDQALVDVTQARNQYEIAEKHLQALQAIGKQQELKRRGPVGIGQREISGGASRAELFGDSQPD